jgi:hypothetical protein
MVTCHKINDSGGIKKDGTPGVKNSLKIKKVVSK